MDERDLALRRTWYACRTWRGRLPAAGMPLVLRGGWRAPEAEAVGIAVETDRRWGVLLALAREAVRAEAAEAGLREDGPAMPCHVLVGRLGRAWMLEIGIEPPGDPEHRRGARFRDFALVELCGSVRAP